MQCLDGLNPAQRRAATLTDWHATVLSCPGSGKTRTVEAKVVYLLSEFPDAFVCCTTFSRAGAQEMKDRILAALPSDLAEKMEKPETSRLEVATFHSLCFRTILAYEKKLSMVSDGEKKYLMAKAARQVGIDPKTDAFEDRKSDLEAIATMDENRLAALDPTSIDFYNRYKQLLNQVGKLDYDDLLLRTLHYLDQGVIHPKPYTHVIADEGQDSDRLMLRWLFHHARAGSLITLFNDDDQAIYGFRNSLGVEMCWSIERELEAQRVTNGTNYRSHSEILECAAQLIEHNVNRVPKELVAHRGPGGSVTFHHLYEEQDTYYLLNELIRPEPRRWFILCRTKADIKQLSAYLMELGIPHKAQVSGSLLGNPSVQAYLEAARSIALRDGRGLELLLQIAGLPDSELDRLTNNLNCPLIQAKLDQIDTTPFIEEQRQLIDDLFSKADVWKAAMREKRDNRALKKIAEWMAANMMAKHDPTPVSTIMRMLTGMKGRALKRIKDLEKFFTEDTGDKSGNEAIIMTAHSSKGLQRDAVLLWNVRQGSYPIEHDGLLKDKAAIDAHYEEERRIFYVAMTRAENELHMIYQTCKKNKTKTTEYQPSQFIAEMGYELGEPTTFDALKD